VYIDCVHDDDPSTHTNDDLVQQSYVVVPPERTIASLPLLLQHVVLAEKSKGNCYKILLFLPATAQVAYYTTLLRDAFGVRVLEMHSKMAQTSRDRTTARFRTATENTIMLNSDVSARGGDYPDVTHVSNLAWRVIARLIYSPPGMHRPRGQVGTRNFGPARCGKKGLDD
jgi:superfamily II DNA/RNA helicase